MTIEEVERWLGISLGY